jgi:hypothetical protein
MPIFSPPTIPDAMRGDINGNSPADRLFGYYPPQEMGVTVYKDHEGNWQQSPYPYQGGSQTRSFDDGVLVTDTTDHGLADAQIVFMGGHEYEITTALADELITAGYGENLGDYPLEKYGASISQSVATDYRALWLNFIRDAGSAVPSDPSRRILGGDCVHVTQTGAAGWLWHWLDAWASGANAVEGDDTYSPSAILLPARNAVVAEGPQGTLGGQAAEPGSINWLDPTLEGLGAETVWWPVGGLRPNLTGDVIVVCHLLAGGGTSGQSNFGAVNTSIINLNFFATYSSHVNTDWGPTANFWLDRFIHDPDNDLVYGYGIEIHQAAKLEGWQFWRWMEEAKNGGVKLCRVPEASINVPSAYEFWTGSSWSPGPHDATFILDDSDKPLRGWTGCPQRIAANHWINVGRRNIFDNHLDVWKADNPAGPWTKICRVPVQFIGDEEVPGYRKISHHATVLPHIPAPANHSVAMLTSTLMGAGPLTFDDVHIQAYTPQFVVIPHNEEV